MNVKETWIELEFKGLAHDRQGSWLSRLFSKPEKYELILCSKQSKDTIVPIVIGSNESEQIAAFVENITHELPLTHDLFKNTINKFNISLDSICIHKLDDSSVFHSKMYYTQNNDIIEVNARVSDAVSLAMRHKGKIYIDKTVFEKCSELFTQ